MKLTKQIEEMLGSPIHKIIAKELKEWIAEVPNDFFEMVKKGSFRYREDKDPEEHNFDMSFKNATDVLKSIQTLVKDNDIAIAGEVTPKDITEVAKLLSGMEVDYDGEEVNAFEQTGPDSEKRFEMEIDFEVVFKKIAYDEHKDELIIKDFSYNIVG
jgi:hypothetical protein